MNASNLPSFNPVTAWESSPSEAIQLSAEQADQALERAKAINDPSQLWQQYINGLAQAGFEQWLKERAPELSIQGEAQPEIPNLPLVQINGFSVCLLPQSHQPDELIDMSPALIDETVPRAHFYVIAAIAEEQSTVEIFALLRQDQLVQKRSLLSLDEDNTYPVPLNWFDGDADSLLLYLRCSDPAAFAQPQAQSTQQSSDQSIAEVLRAKPKQLIQAAVNTALWFDGIMDEMSQQLAWVLLPSPPLAAPRFAMRGGEPENLRATNECYQILQTLRNQGVAIPDHLRPATKEFAIGSAAVRLYALAWSTSPTDWELLLILGPVAGQCFPRDVRLVVEDQTEELVEQRLPPGSREAFIFANLTAETNEIFKAKIKLGESVAEVLPAFSFHPRQS